MLQKFYEIKAVFRKARMWRDYSCMQHNELNGYFIMCSVSGRRLLDNCISFVIHYIKI